MLLIAYPNTKLSKRQQAELINLWIEDLGGLSEQRLEACFKVVRQNGAWFPKIADILKANDNVTEYGSGQIALPPASRFNEDRTPGASSEEIHAIVAEMLRRSGDEQAASDADYVAQAIDRYYPNFGCLNAQQLQAACYQAMEEIGNVMPDEEQVLVAHGRLMQGTGNMRRDYGAVMGNIIGRRFQAHAR